VGRGGGYAFGDGDAPARRLALLAEVFGPTSREFLLREAPADPRLALDLGCGAGHTTGLIAETLRPLRTLGLDVSPDFVARAIRRAPPGVAFAVHDVVGRPFPEGPPDLVYARLLVAHLAAPEAIVAGWAAQLAPGGALLIEDTDAIETEEPVFAEYLARVAERLRAGGHRLYPGPLLAALAHSSRLAAASPAAGLAAAMFRLNLDSWCDDPDVRGRLAGGLEELFGDPRSGVITWRLRQAVLRQPRR
jgi:trans-aconitate 2-methyltransferase